MIDGEDRGDVMPADEYCRRIERYLTQKNDGHLIRIVGPAFERVLGWAAQGIPLNVAFKGIDRYFERYYAKGPRRRPVRIEFCEADILDAFDDWRRAVGLSAGRSELVAGASAPPRRRDSLARQIERAVTRLTALRAASAEPRPISLPDDALGDAVATLDRLLAEARTSRGNARLQVIEQAAAVDRRLVDAARAAAGQERMARLERDAADELAPFRERMPAGEWSRAKTAAVDRLLREQAGLPVPPGD